MADGKIDTSRLDSKPQSISDAYAVPANFLEIDISNPQTHGVGKKRYTDYEVRMKTNIPIFKLKESTVRRRYSDFEWLRTELERDSKIVVPQLPGKALKKLLPFRGDDGIFEDEFIEERRQGLEAFVNRVAGHPLAQNERCLHMFLQEPIIDKNYVPGKIARCMPEPSGFLEALWLGINGLLFGLSYVKFDKGKDFFYLNFLLKESLPVARGSAAMLNFNCMLILLPVCRNLLSFIRDLPCLPHSVSRIMDKNITFHRCIAYMICFATALHLGSHIFNFERLINSWERDSTTAEGELVQYLNNNLNPIRKGGLNPVIELIKTVAGITGIIITLALIIMVSSSTELIRRSYFEVFWFTHHLFVIFFIGLLFHGFGELLRAQTNIEAHNPSACGNATVFKTCLEPQFKAKGPQTWKWIVGPMGLYVIERLIRFYRSFQTCEVKKVVKHPSKVIEIQMRKPGFRAQAGQYIFLHCPQISPLEWHPFTLTSCPEEDFFSVHIRVVGDWTEALSKFCGDAENVDIKNIPRLACDGPFGTASTDVFYYENVICCGAGIGVTPFASILKSIWYRYEKGDANFAIKKVYFYWICPDTNAFEWFSDLLQSLENQMTAKGISDFLEYHIYLSRGWGKADARAFAMHEGDEADVITGLKQKTNFGRPNWDQIFTNAARKHEGSDVGVFFCGPAVLSHQLHVMSNKHSNDKCRFFYNKENF